MSDQKETTEYFRLVETFRTTESNHEEWLGDEFHSESVTVQSGQLGTHTQMSQLCLPIFSQLLILCLQLCHWK